VRQAGLAAAALVGTPHFGLFSFQPVVFGFGLHHADDAVNVEHAEAAHIIERPPVVPPANAVFQ
jgi:hypothetical protein